MLDTNIVSDLMRNPGGRAAGRLAAHGSAGICLSIITSAELRYGAARKGSPTLSARLNAVLATLDIVPFDVPADTTYGVLRAGLAAAGTPIGPNDLLIAAHALSLNVTLVTHNVAEFTRVPGLTVENWLT